MPTLRALPVSPIGSSRTRVLSPRPLPELALLPLSARSTPSRTSRSLSPRCCSWGVLEHHRTIEVLPKVTPPNGARKVSQEALDVNGAQVVRSRYVRDQL